MLATVEQQCSTTSLLDQPKCVGLHRFLRASLNSGRLLAFRYSTLSCDGFASFRNSTSSLFIPHKSSLYTSHPCPRVLHRGLTPNFRPPLQDHDHPATTAAGANDNTDTRPPYMIENPRRRHLASHRANTARSPTSPFSAQIRGRGYHDCASSTIIAICIVQGPAKRDGRRPPTQSGSFDACDTSSTADKHPPCLVAPSYMRRSSWTAAGPARRRA
ncbi:hypothetical protein BJ912DRAFT_228603 [Pholiota molesta]|nr:hypothetical protein BJ912DRAFT_228603 [Pholiota molesta]